jgi:hypothetical protein
MKGPIEDIKEEDGKGAKASAEKPKAAEKPKH